MKRVIGKYFVTEPGLQDQEGLTEQELCERFGDTHLCFGTIGKRGINPIKRIKERRARNAVDYINSIGGRITEYDNDTGLTKLEYNKPIPFKYIKRIFIVENVHFIYENEQKNIVTGA